MSDYSSSFSSAPGWDPSQAGGACPSAGEGSQPGADEKDDNQTPFILGMILYYTAEQIIVPSLLFTLLVL